LTWSLLCEAVHLGFLHRYKAAAMYHQHYQETARRFIRVDTVNQGGQQGPASYQHLCESWPCRPFLALLPFLPYMPACRLPRPPDPQSTPAPAGGRLQRHGLVSILNLSQHSKVCSEKMRYGRMTIAVGPSQGVPSVDIRVRAPWVPLLYPMNTNKPLRPPPHPPPSEPVPTGKDCDSF
jgi:hypothetical protein